jgi:hypothetical protein
MSQQLSTSFIQVFSFFAMLLYIGALAYFVVAKLLFKKPTHGAEILLLEEDAGVKLDE